jgi:hypothetical protein
MSGAAPPACCFTGVLGHCRSSIRERALSVVVADVRTGTPWPEPEPACESKQMSSKQPHRPVAPPEFVWTT